MRFGLADRLGGVMFDVQQYRSNHIPPTIDGSTVSTSPKFREMLIRTISNIMERFKR